MKIQIPETEEGPFYKHRHNLLAWGEKEWKIANKHIESYRVCLDIGAHVGLTTIRYSKHFEKVYSFEPVMFEYLSANTSEIDNVIIHNCAVGEFEESLTMYPNPFNTGRSIVEAPVHKKRIDRHWKSANGKMKDIDPVIVQGNPIDKYSFSEVDFIKIDVEGYNLPVLKGMDEMLKRNNPVMQIESCETPEDDKIMFKHLDSIGYRLVDQCNGNPMDWIFKRT